MKYRSLFLIGICAFTISCKDQQEKATIEVFPVTSPAILDTNISVDYVAEILAVQNIEIRAKAQGYLEKVHVDEGSFVKVGQLLYSINSREYSEALSKNRAMRKLVQAEAKNAELELQNTRKLFEKNIVSKFELEFAQNKLQAANAKVEEAIADEAHAKHMLSYTEIRAPFSGRINRIPHKIGSLIEQGTLLTQLSKDDELFVYFDISEKEYLDFMSNITNESANKREVKLVLANGNLHKVSGLIETMDGQIDEKTGNIAFRARFKNPDFLLKHGASGKIRIEKDLKNVLIIPQKSTFDIQDRTYVYLVDQNNKVKMQQVVIKNRIPNFYVISKGITSKSKIIYEGIQTVNDGITIKPNFVPFKKIIQDLADFQQQFETNLKTS